MKYIIGIDVGTTNIKAAVFNEDGIRLGLASAPSPKVNSPESLCVFYPDELWHTVCSLVTEAVESTCAHEGVAAKRNIVGIAVTGMAESGVLLDERGHELYPIIVWNDPCTRGMEVIFSDRFGSDRLLAITGQRAQYNYSVNKIMWIANNHPEIMSKAARWMCVPDYIAYRFSGKAAMDYSIACRTMLFDIYNKKWSAELCKFADIDPDILPELVPSSTYLGDITDEAARMCGLDKNVGVFAGGHDHICGALAAGILEPGDVLDSSGTAEQFLTVPESVEFAAGQCEAGYNIGIHTARGLYYISGAVPASGKTVDWFKREFGAAVSGELTPGANGLVFLPHLDGGSSPRRDPGLSGAFSGIRPNHTAADFMQAVYEGLSCELCLGIHGLLGGKEPVRIVSTGGGTQNTHWMQTKANVLQREITVPGEYQSTVMGAALLAGIGSKLYSDPLDAVRKTFRTGCVYSPKDDIDHHKLLERYKNA